MMQRWNIADILQQLHRCSAELHYNGNDGFIQWGCKQDLYRVKFELDKMLNTAPTFADEGEWLEQQRVQQEQQQIWKALNDKTSN